MILGEAPNPAPGRDVGLYSVELLDAAYLSAAQDGLPIKTASLY